MTSWKSGVLPIRESRCLFLLDSEFAMELWKQLANGSDSKVWSASSVGVGMLGTSSYDGQLCEFSMAWTFS
jgi:hypothetical protein